MTVRGAITVEVNGAPVELAAGASLVDAVAATGVDPERRGIAAALDGEVVPREEWGSARLGEGQRVEVVQAIQGG